ncbi:MAG: GIY-YIG nuclease family protein [Pseudomonadota bacterium]
MAKGFAFRRNAVRTLTSQIGVYVLCDLDNTPVYVGQSSDGIRQRVQRHLTSARSDVIANRQIDVWEIAFVWEYPVMDKAEMNPLEAMLFHHFNPHSRLMNGTVPLQPVSVTRVPEPSKIVQVMSDDEIAEKKTVELRLPRQADHYAQIVGHFLVVKNSNQIAAAMDAHFARLSKYHSVMLGLGSDEEGE